MCHVGSDSGLGQVQRCVLLSHVLCRAVVCCHACTVYKYSSLVSVSAVPAPKSTLSCRTTKELKSVRYPLFHRLDHNMKQQCVSFSSPDSWRVEFYLKTGVLPRGFVAHEVKTA